MYSLSCWYFHHTASFFRHKVWTEEKRISTLIWNQTNPRKPPKNPPATSLTPRTYPLHEVNELTRQTNLNWRRTSRRYKTTIPWGKKKLPKFSKLALVSSGIVRRSRVYRVRGSRGVTMAYLVNLWNVVWLFWLRTDVALWASIVASVGWKKETCWKPKFFWILAKKEWVWRFFLFQQKLFRVSDHFINYGLAVLYWFEIGLVARVPSRC